jgi:hypothetical protein
VDTRRRETAAPLADDTDAMSTDFELDQAEPFGEEHEADQHVGMKKLNVLSAPVPLTSEELEEKYRNITHQTIAEDGILFDEEDGSTVWCGMIAGTDRLIEVTQREDPENDDTT